MIEPWLKAIRDHPGRPPAAQCWVLAMLAERLDWKTGHGFASTRQLMADADASSATVERATRWARNAGLLKEVSRGHRLGDGRKRATEWALSISTHQQGGVEGGAQSVTAASQPIASDGLRSGLNPSAEPSSTHQRSDASRPVIHQDLSDRRSDRPDRRSAADAADRAEQIRWAFTDEQLPQVLSIVADAARQHLKVIVDPGSQVSRYLLRTLTRSGKRYTRDIAKYAAASFASDPDKWRTLAVAATDHDGHVPDGSYGTWDDYATDVLSSNGARARGQDYDKWTDQDFWDEHGQHQYLDLRNWEDA